MAVYIYPAQSLSIPGVATEATLLLVEANTAATVVELQDINSELNTHTSALANIETNTLDTVTQLQAANTELNAQSAILLDIEADTTIAASRLQSLDAKTASADFTLPFDTLVVTSKSVNGPLVIQSRLGGLGGTLVQTKTIVYDIDGDFQSSVVV